MAKKQKIRDLVKPVDNGGLYSKYGEVFNLLLNAVKIVSKDTKEEINYDVETFVKTSLFERNIVGVVDWWFDSLCRIASPNPGRE